MIRVRQKTGSFKLILIGLLLMIPVVAQAAAPTWFSGYPKLANKNAMLMWNNVEGATEYNVYRSEEKGKAGKILTKVKTNKYLDSNVPGGKTFFYSVSAVVGGKETSRSSEAPIKTAKEQVYEPLATPKIAGHIVKDKPGGGKTVNIRWEGGGGSDLTGYNLYKSRSKDKDYIMIASVNADRYEDEDIKPGESYYYSITAVDSQFHETKRSEPFKVDIPKPVVAEAPKQLKNPATQMRKAKPLYIMDKYKDKSGKPVPIGPVVDVVVDEAVGHVYLLDGDFGGVHVFDLKGKFQFSINKSGRGATDKWTHIHGLAIGPAGRIYVSGASQPDIGVYDIDGRLLQMIKVEYEEKTEKKPKIWDMAVNNEGDIFVSDIGVERIHKLDRNGKKISEFGYKKGKDEKPVQGPSWCSMAKDGSFLVVDSSYGQVMLYDADGKFIKAISKPGQNAGELWFPSGISVDSKGDVFVANGTSTNIQAFSMDGKFLYALSNEKLDGPIPSAMLRGIYIDSGDRLYVSESLWGKVTAYQLMEGVSEIVPNK